jgi:hypothetical protein
MISSTSAANRWSSCEMTWKNLAVSLLMPAKENCASAWANHTAGRSAQNGESRTATLDTSAGGELSAASTLRRGRQCGLTDVRGTHVLTALFSAVVTRTHAGSCSERGWSRKKP